MLLPSIVKFANGNEDAIKTYEKFRDYYFHYMSEVENKKYGAYDQSVSLEDKEKAMNTCLMSEIERVSGSKRGDMSIEMYAQNPMVRFAYDAIIATMIDAILPETIVKQAGIWSEVKTVGYGENAHFTIEPNSIYTISESSEAKRFSFNKKEFAIDYSMGAVNHQITVSAEMYKVLAGVESLARFVRKAVVSMETQMGVDAYRALATLVANANFPTQLKVAGYDVDKLIGLCQTVQAYNGGAKPAIIGTKRALYKMLPDSAKGYRMVTDAENPKVNIISGFFDWDIIELDQVATGKEDYSMVLDDTKLYIVSTGADKLIKGVIEGSATSYTDAPHDNADLSQRTTLTKRYAFDCVGNAVMGVVDLA